MICQRCGARASRARTTPGASSLTMGALDQGCGTRGVGKESDPWMKRRVVPMSVELRFHGESYGRRRSSSAGRVSGASGLLTS